MPTASASTESIPQRGGHGIAALVRNLSVRRQQPSYPRSQRRQDSLPREAAIKVPSYPVGEETNETKVSERTTSIPRPSGKANWRNEQHASSRIRVVAPIKAEDENEISLAAGWDHTSGVDFDESALVAFSPRDTAGDTEHRVDADTRPAQSGYERERPDAPKFHSLSAGVDAGEGGRSAPHGPPNKLRRKKDRTPHPTPTAILRYVWGNFKAEEPTQADSPQLSTQPGSMSSKSLRPRAKLREEKELPPVPLYADDDQKNMSNTKDREQIARESEEIKRLRRDLSDSHHQIAELRKRCEAQSRDLESSNNFFSAADKSSDSDIIHALERLNAEVQQNTMYMAEWLAEDLEFGDVSTNLTKERTLAIQRTSEHIGQVLAKSLATKTPEDVPMLLQIAFQAYLASALLRIVSSWAFEPAHTAFIDGIYRRLRKVGKETKCSNPSFFHLMGGETWSTEAQAISGRWRTLARVHIVHNCVSDSGLLVKGIIAGLSDILLAAGCTASQSDAILKVSSRFGERIALLVELSGRLNKLFDEVVSCDFEVFFVRPGESFEEKKMEDADEDQLGKQEGPVLCATHLGLIKRIPVGSLWESGRKQKVVVLKAKVLLESFLHTEE